MPTSWWSRLSKTILSAKRYNVPLRPGRLKQEVAILVRQPTRERWVARAPAPYSEIVLGLSKTSLMPMQFLVLLYHALGELAYISIPAQLISLHRYVTLAAEVMFVLGLPFFITLSWRIRFMTVQFMPCRKAPELANALKSVINLYKHVGFIFQITLMDNEFDKIKDHLHCIKINSTAKNKHVTEIKQMTWHVKELTLCIKAEMGSTTSPMLSSSIWSCMRLCSSMPMSIHKAFLMSFHPENFFYSCQKHCRGQFGAYCQAFNHPDST